MIEAKAKELLSQLLDAGLENDEAFIAECNLPRGATLALTNLVALCREASALEDLLHRREAERDRQEILLLELLRGVPG